ncbi:MAG: TRAP transporter small permease, partial [Glaciecola sp.]
YIVVGLKYLVTALVAAIVIVVSLQVFSRFILGDSNSITEELARFLLIWIGLFGAAYGYYTNAHLGLDIFVNKLNQLPQLLTGMLAHSFILFFALVVMIIGGYSLVMLTLEPVQISAAMEIKMAYVYSAIPFSGLLIVFFALSKLRSLFKLVVAHREGM